MLTKKLFSLMLSAILLMSITIPAVAVSEADPHVSPMYVYINNASSSLTISDGTATIESYVQRTSAGSNISLTATLQKYSNGSWKYVTSWSDSTTAVASYISETYDVSAGTYRVATYYSVSGASGSESNTIYRITRGRFFCALSFSDYAIAYPCQP